MEAESGESHEEGVDECSISASYTFNPPPSGFSSLNNSNELNIKFTHAQVLYPFTMQCTLNSLSAATHWPFD